MASLKNIFTAFSFLLVISNGFSQGTTCGGADPACAGGGYVFQNTTGGTTAEPGPDYGCLGDQPNPAWFYLQIGASGDLDFSIVQNSNQDMVSGTPIDVDFICYGPFTQGDDYCNNLTPRNTVGCSFSANAVENFTIFNAQEDEVYILLITNYDNLPGYIELNQTNANVGGAGETDCSIVDDISVCENSTHNIDVTESGATYSWSFDDGSGEVPIVGETSSTLQVPVDIDGNGTVDVISGAYIATIVSSSGSTNTVINNVSFGEIYNPGTSNAIELCEFDATLQDLEATIGTHDDGNGTGFWSDDDGSGVNLTTPNAVDFSSLSNGVYNYTYTIPENNGCPEVSATVTVTISELLLAGSDGTLEFCETEPMTQDLFAALTGAPDLGGTWSDISVIVSNVDLTDPSAVDFSMVSDGVYEFEYLMSVGSCPDSSSKIVVTIQNIQYAGENVVIEFCEGELNAQNLFNSLGVHPTSGQSADSGGVWAEISAIPSGVDLSDPTAVDFSTVPDGQYEFTYTFDATGICPVNQATIEVLISNLANPGQSGFISLCEGETIMQDLVATILNEDSGGLWAEANGTNSGVDLSDPTAVDFSSVIPGEYIYQYYFDANGSCERIFSTVTVTVSEYFSAGTSNTLILCEGDDTLNSLFVQLGTDAEWGGIWSDDDNTLIDISDVNQIDFSSLAIGDYDFTYTQPINGTCPSTNATITVSINPIPEASNPLEPFQLSMCDDDNDGHVFFDLDGFSDQISRGNPDLIVTYFETTEQLNSGFGAVISPYQNIIQDAQTLYVRVTNQLTGCYNTLETLQLTVLESPELPSGEIVYDLCEDNGSNDGYVEFDLMDYALNTLGLDPILTIEFFTGLDTSGNPIGYISNFNNYTNVTTPDQVIYLVVSNANTDSNGDACTIIRSMTLHVNLLPNVPVLHDIFECDDDYFDEADGIYPFNLSAEIDVITGGVTGLVVEFYEVEADAQAGSGPSLITNPSEFYNTLGPGGDDVFARVYDASTGCAAITHIKLHVDANPTPLSNQEIIDQLGHDGVMEECDGNVDGSGSIAEQVAEFDLTSWETLILTGTGSGIETGVSASYYTSYDDADGATNAIGTPDAYTNTSNPQTIYVRVTSDGTGIIPQTSGTGCYTIVQFDIFVPVPAVSVSGDTVLCIDEDGVPLSGTTLPVLTASPSTGGYEYQWALNGVDIPGAINETHTVTEAGVYTVTVSGPMDYDCVNSASITVEESGMPSGYDANVTTTAFADNHQIQATATSNIPGVVFYYTLDLDATTGIGVETNTTGLFTDVGPGLHYITITDGKACWSDVVEVLVIDYPHFFTPNGDGVNDTWQIIGVEGIPISIIYIFDRYGKLITQLDPDGTGWDGTYNGHGMPAGDYWFTIDYTEGAITPTQKEYKNNFSLKR